MNLWMDRIIQIGNLIDEKNFSNPQCGRVYSVRGICPTINTMQGGGESRRLPSSSKLSDGICCATTRFSTIRVVGWVYESRQNGAVFDVRGLAPCLSVGCHSGVEPKIGIVYETD